MIDTSFLTDDVKSTLEGHMVATDRTVAALTKVLQDTQASRIFEIGFNAGHSACMWLELNPDLYLNSVDICQHKYTIPNAAKIKQRYGDRFDFYECNSINLTPAQVEGFDTCFVDGDHSVAGLTSDLVLCSRANVKYIIVDDYHEKWFRSVTDLVNHFLKKDDFPYEKMYTFDYDSRSGNNTAILLKRV